MAINTSYGILTDVPRIMSLSQYTQDAINDLDARRIHNERKFRKATWRKNSRSMVHRRIHFYGRSTN